MDSVELVALSTGLILLCAIVWIWVPYITARPKPQHATRRREAWDWPHRMPASPPERPLRSVQRLGRLPETWDEYRSEINGRNPNGQR